MFSAPKSQMHKSWGWGGVGGQDVLFYFLSQGLQRLRIYFQSVCGEFFLGSEVLAREEEEEKRAEDAGSTDSLRNA